MRSFQGKLRRRNCLFAAGLIAANAVLFGQIPQDPSLPSPPSLVPPSGSLAGRGTPGSGPDASQDPMLRHAMEQAAKQRIIERQHKMVADTDRICALAQELNETINQRGGKGGGEAVSAATLKKMDEIEKLARGVRDRMRAD
jgi:hypothetical protein